MEVICILGSLFVIYYLWLNILATIAVRYDQTLNVFQRKAQTLFVWLIPVFGSAMVLHFIWQHYPDAIPKSWIPWPFKQIIYGKPTSSNKNGNNDESSGAGGSGGGH